MTDIQVSDCCGAGIVVKDGILGILTCKKCKQPCKAVWKIIIDGPDA